MKPSEKRLLLLLLGLAVVGGIVLSSGLYFEKCDELRADREALDEEWAYIEKLFEEKELWELRANWLAANQPKFTSSDKVANDIFEIAQAKGVEGVEASKQVLIPIDEEESLHYIEAGVSLQAKGALPDVLRWIYELSQPETFRVVRDLSLTPDKGDPESVIPKFDLLRWYDPKNI